MAVIDFSAYRQRRIATEVRKAAQEVAVTADLLPTLLLVSVKVHAKDPQAALHLREAIAKAEEACAKLRAANEAIFANEKNTLGAAAALSALGFSESDVRTLLEPDAWGHVGYASRQIGALMKQLRVLRTKLGKLEYKEVASQVFGDVEMREAKGRTMLVFGEPPTIEMRADLKAHGFRWSAEYGAYHVKASGPNRYVARTLAQRFAEAQQVAPLRPEDAAERLPEFYRGKSLEQLRREHEAAGWYWNPITGEWSGAFR